MKILALFKVIFAKDNVDDVEFSARSIGIWGSLFFALVSAMLTALNIDKGYWLMATTTTGLIVGFLIAAFCAYKDKIKSSRVITVILCGIIFSYYAISGENEGFAILWILLVPLIGSYLVGLCLSFCLSAYFQIFLIVLFYTPLSASVNAFYTDTFMMRFPLLYFADFISVTLLMCQRQKLFNEAQKLANCDMMTGLLNRNYYNQIQDSLNNVEDHQNLSLMAFDVNGLKTVNDTLGHKAGDELICGVAKVLKQCFPDDLIFRIGGDEFVVLSEKSDAHKGLQAFEKGTHTWHSSYGSELHVSTGSASRRELPNASFQELSFLADKCMYADKANYYQQEGRNRRQR